MEFCSTTHKFFPLEYECYNGVRSKPGDSLPLRPFGKLRVYNVASAFALPIPDGPTLAGQALRLAGCEK